MTLLARILLALYPRDVRDRYGEEIADLLRHSRLPWRDAADVAWCALIERVSRPPRLTWLVPIGLVAMVAVWFWQPRIYPLTILPWLIVLAAAAGARLGRRSAAPWYQHPLAALTCFGLAWFLPAPNVAASVVAYACWVAGGMLLVRAVRRVRRLAVAVIGGALFLELFSVVWFGLQRGFDQATWRWLPEALLSLTVELGDTPRSVNETFALLLLAPPLALVLSYAYRSRRPAPITA